MAYQTLLQTPQFKFQIVARLKENNSIKWRGALCSQPWITASSAVCTWTRRLSSRSLQEAIKKVVTPEKSGYTIRLRTVRTSAPQISVSTRLHLPLKQQQQQNRSIELWYRKPVGLALRAWKWDNYVYLNTLVVFIHSMKNYTSIPTYQFTLTLYGWFAWHSRFCEAQRPHSDKFSHIPICRTKGQLYKEENKTRQRKKKKHFKKSCGVVSEQRCTSQQKWTDIRAGCRWSHGICYNQLQSQLHRHRWALVADDQQLLVEESCQNIIDISIRPL